MAEGLAGDQDLVGEWDAGAGLWLARAWVPGPAGSAGLALGDGVEIDVDVASPAVLAGVTVEAPAPEGSTARAALVALLGADASGALLAVPPGPPARLAGGGGRGAGRRGGRRGGGLRPELARAALAGASAVTAPPLPRAVALLEASAAASTLGAVAGLASLARADAEAGARIVLELATDGALRLDHLRTARELAAALRRAATLLGARTDLVDLAAQVDAGRFGPEPQPAAADALRPLKAGPPAREAAPAAAPAAAAAAPRLRVVQPVEVDRSSLPEGVAAAQVGAVVAGPAEVEVQLAGAAGRAAGWWARATAPDGTTLALAPVVDLGGDAAARLLVPPAAVRTLEVDLTGDPASPRLSTRLRATQRAVRLGQQAARASRLGLPAATARWAACATAWAEAGDPVRAARCTDGSRAREAGPPLVVDHLLER